jgi:hypothetical protein
MKKQLIILLLALCAGLVSCGKAKSPIDYVNLNIGSLHSHWFFEDGHTSIEGFPTGYADTQAQKSILPLKELKCIVCPHYKNRANGQPGREILLVYEGVKTLNNIRLDIVSASGSETLQLKPAGSDTIPILLPPPTGVSKDEKVQVILTAGKIKTSCAFTVPAMRHWKVYIYPHSHVDIGYTNTQANVEIIHKRNLINGMKLAKETAHYPQDARYLWNPEVMWPVERYLNDATPKERTELLDAIRKNYICLDAGYVHTNTSASSGEELFELLRYSKSLEKLTGQKIETLVQVDIPGLSWGVVPIAAQLHIPYCLSLFNGYDRVGNAPDFNFKPFWWLAPDGKSKMLFLQPGSYNPGALAKGKNYWPQMAGQTDPSKLLQIVKTNNPRADFIDRYLDEKLPELEKSADYPYDIFPMSWAMADNTPIDADLPDAVKSWNEEFAYPHLIICSATQMMKAFDEQYGNTIPVLSGDYTEYWTDGLGTSAKHAAMNRTVKERLVQTETLWSMLNPFKPFPRQDMDEAWRNVILGTEHTWAFMDPGRQPISNDILNTKLGYFEEAGRRSHELLLKTFPLASGTEHATFAVFNTHSWTHGGLVVLTAEQSRGYHSVTDLETGTEALSQRLSTGKFVFMAEDIPALGCKKYRLRTNRSKTKGSFINGNTLDNGIIKATVDELTGDVTSCIYGGKEFVDLKNVSALNSYRYLKGDDSPGKASKAVNNRITVKEDGPVLATLSVTSDAEGCTGLTREISVIAGQSYIELNNTVDKMAITEKEGIHFGFAFDIPHAVTRVDIPWGVMELEKDQLEAGNRNWIAFQRWLNISNEEKAVTWCSLDACLFESGDMTANILGGAAGSPKWIRRLNPDATIYSWALNNHWHTNFRLSQDDKVSFRYRILPQNGKYEAAIANRFGIAQIQPLLASPIDETFHFEPNLSVKSDASVVVSVIKTADDGKSSIIRLRSVSDVNQDVILEWKSKQPKALLRCHYGEEKEGASAVSGKVTVPAMGFVTLRAEW